MFVNKCLHSPKSPGNQVENPGKGPDFGQTCRSEYVFTSCCKYVNSGHIRPGFQNCPKNIVLKCFDCPGFLKM